MTDQTDQSDVEEFVEQADKYRATAKPMRAKDEAAPEGQKAEEPKRGEVCQYSEYGPGYKAVSRTLPSLPKGCYDICADSNGVYVVPTLPPTGLLLELPEMRSEHVVELVESFWKSEKDYKEGNEFVHGGAAYKAGIMLFGPPGCHAKGTKILMFDGTQKNVEDVAVGDLLMGPDSTPRAVLELKRGREKMVKITPIKGEPFVVNKSHILHLTPSHKNEIVRCPINMSVEDLLKNTSECFKDRYKLTRTGVDFEEKELAIPPYILGLWLGDGTSTLPSLTSMDRELVDIWTEYGKSLGLEMTASKQRSNSKANAYTMSTQTSLGGEGRNEMTNRLRELGVLNNKHIPHQYLTSSRKDRLELLAGLIDTDGYAGTNVVTSGKKGTGYDFISKWEHLANEFVFLCRSLGFAAYMQKCTKGCYVGKEEYFTGEYYRVSVSGDLEQVPTVLARKKCKPIEQIKNVLRTGFDFQEMPEDDFYGFTLNTDHLYLTGDFTIHHNSGKSCTIKIVSKKLIERDGTVFFADSSPTQVNAFLTDFARVERNRKCIVILEDFDSLIAKYNEDGYLKMLDSANSIDNVMFIATTNYPERLDPRIYNRPGRFSQVVKIGLPTPAARTAFLKAILKNHRDVEKIVELTEKFSIDHLSSLVNGVYREKKDLEKEIERLRKLFKVPKADETGPMGLNVS